MDYNESLKKLLAKVKQGKLSVESALSELSHLPYQDMGSVKLDTHRFIRQGFPEVIYAAGKTEKDIIKCARAIIKHKMPLLITRTDEKIYLKIKKLSPGIKYSAISKAIYQPKLGKRTSKTVPIITGGTSDLPIADEARVTLETMGHQGEIISDVGVAGIHRLMDCRKKLSGSKVIIVVAGMEGALASVVSGMVKQPVIAVPTSVGYGASFNGLAALLTMLNSCAPGIVTVNIDNGFGAGYFAGLINT